MDYSILAKKYDAIAATTKRLEKTKIISELLKKAEDKDVDALIRLLQGKIFPEWAEQKLGVSHNYVIKALSKISGQSENKIKELWKTIGDLGEVAEKLLQKKGQATLFQKKLSIIEVLESLQKLASEEGMGSVERKTGIISSLLSSASAVEGKYLVRSVLEDLRVGVSNGTLRDAIVWAFLFEVTDELIIENREKYNEIVKLVDDAYNKANDFTKVAIAAKKGIEEIKKIDLVLGKPIKVMLGPKERSIADAFKRVGVPAALEYKLDGFRTQIHKEGEKVRLFTRRLDEVTKQFPDVVEYVKKYVKPKNCILDSEIVGIDNKGNYLVFQNISQRIRRKYGIEEMAKKLPVEVNVFDIISINGTSIINLPFKERTKLLTDSINQVVGKLVKVKQIITDKEFEAKKFYEESLKKGNEGLMFKNLESPYSPGARIGAMVKLKAAKETLDLTVIGGEWGTGKRSGWLTSLNLACFDPTTNQFLAIGKVGTGLKEKTEEGLSFEEITNLLKENIIEEKGREVTIKPTVVLEIEYEELQESTSYESGYALRFPRVKTLRDDRGPEECTTLQQIEQYAKE